jgi:hypothetical protein
MNFTGTEMRSIYDRLSAKQALITVHELLHFTHGDITLARAVAALNEDKKSTLDGVGTASPYWNKELQVQCDPTYQTGKY